MRRFLVAAAFSLLSVAAFAQGDSTQPRTTISVPGSLPRSNDHFLLQFGYTQWQGAPDSIRTGGLPRTFNAYLMLDFPFKTNPHWSVALGAGIGTDAIFFDKGSVDIAGTTPTLVFRNLADTNHFKRYKLATAYAEAPLELRYAAKPEDNRRSIKAALGVKIGTLLNAHTKGSTLQNKNGGTINDFKQKDFNKRYFNKLRLAATARLGFGHFSLFASYQLTPLFREGLAPTIRPVTVGLTLSGL
jgi:hypothetical protein